MFVHCPKRMGRLENINCIVLVVIWFPYHLNLYTVLTKKNNEQEFVEFEKLNTIINLPSVCYVTKRKASQLTNMVASHRFPPF